MSGKPEERFEKTSKMRPYGKNKDDPCRSGGNEKSTSLPRLENSRGGDPGEECELRHDAESEDRSCQDRASGRHGRDQREPRGDEKRFRIHMRKRIDRF